MHVLQYIAIKAETADEAYHYVENQLQEMLSGESSGAWFDWYVCGGGRWNTGTGDKWEEAYVEGKTNMIVSSDNLEEFLAIVDSCIDSRMTEFNRYRNEWERSNINLEATFDDFDGAMDYSMQLYSLGKLIDMYQGKWDFNSYYYDLEHWSTNPKWMTEDRINNGGIWYLVPVDFHY